MDWTLTQAYYLIGSLSGVIATLISLNLYFRSRPNRLKEKVIEVLEPVVTRVKQLEKGQADIQEVQAEAAKRHDASVRALDHEVTQRLKELGSHVDEQYREVSSALVDQGRVLERIATKLEHGISRRDIDILHSRITETSKSVANVSGVMDRLTAQVTHIDDFIRGGNRS